MKTAAELARRSLTTTRKFQPQSAKDSRPRLNPKWTSALFKKFEAIWGDKWTRNFSDIEILEIAEAEWGEALVELSPAEIRSGIDTAKAAKEWPPSIAEFIAMAKGSVEQRGAAYRTYARALPKPRADKAIVSKNIEQMRGILRGNAEICGAGIAKTNEIGLGNGNT